MRVCLFEDQDVESLEPLVLTRPAFELLCGQDSLRCKQCRYFASQEVGALVRPYLASLYRLQQPDAAVNDLAWLRAEATILVNARWLPPLPPSSPPAALDDPCVAMIGDEVAYAVVAAEHLAGCSPNTLTDCLETWKNDLPRRPAGGYLIRNLWDLIERNAEQLVQDFQLTTTRQPPRRPEATPALIGPADRLLIERTARLDPLIVADTTRGPVVIDREAVITAFSRLEGPCYIGPRTHVLGAKIRAGTTLGPNCRVGGEVEASILHGNTNKYHDGFLGHSYVGEWVNFGAGTQSSDLRNDYGEVTVPVGGQPVATGLSKVGCFIGDHTKTGLGALINTGTSAGVFCNLLPCGRLLPRYFPSFSSCWNGALAANSSLPQLLQTARDVMRRRGATLTEVHAALFRHLFDQSAAERQRLLSSVEQRALRRSA
jgi:UDP-N-acetylglucosamine diphosphorylase / glucose-1-phosphate thymidylyltransferase / UDP-N-acetylgalactosamine diphosphorylase / glucosamine-1-phosphate N-acetyltransferase / galactosamine-1-phosphate N-acetyltransferase